MTRSRTISTVMAVGLLAGAVLPARLASGQPPIEEDCGFFNNGPVCQHIHDCNSWDPYTWQCNGYSDLYKYYP